MGLERGLRYDVGGSLVKGKDMVVGGCCWRGLKEVKGEFIGMCCEGTDRWAGYGGGRG